MNPVEIVFPDLVPSKYIFNVLIQYAVSLIALMLCETVPIRWTRGQMHQNIARNKAVSVPGSVLVAACETVSNLVEGKTCIEMDTDLTRTWRLSELFS